MLIKQQALASHLARSLSAVYILIGQDHFLLNDAAENIKHAWRQKNDESEVAIMHVSHPSDWTLLDEKANSYSLFANAQLIDVRYEKKSLDAAGKLFLTNYLGNINQACLLLLRAPNIPHKQLQSFINHHSLQIVQANPLSGLAMQNWITAQLQKKAITFEQQVPTLIHQYTQGNMLACAQVLEKLELILAKDITLTTALLKDQLVDQCNYQLFELSDACLANNPDKIIQLLQHAYNTSIEPTLILWLLTQELRLLIQLIELTNKHIPFATACTQLKIWSQRTGLYQSALKNVDLEHLLRLLHFCKKIDERIKSNHINQVWHALEQVALSLCLGKQVGYFA